MKFRTMMQASIVIGAAILIVAVTAGTLTGNPNIFMPLVIGGAFWAFPATVAHAFIYLDRDDRSAEGSAGVRRLPQRRPRRMRRPLLLRLPPAQPEHPRRPAEVSAMVTFITCPLCGLRVVAVRKVEEHDHWDLGKPPIDSSTWTFYPCAHELGGKDPRMEGWKLPHDPRG